MSSSSQILSLAGWWFLPNLITGYLQSILYTILIRAGDPKPQPGTPRYARDARNIRIAVIVAYLLYTIYEADATLQQAGDFYRLLGVPADASDKVIQTRFRRLTVQYHPDKATGADRASIESLYVQLKLARDTLTDPIKRFAYDRFGPEILTWQNSKTLRDYIFHGLYIIAASYIGSAGFLVLLSVLGYFRGQMYWRYVAMATMVVLEVHVATRPYFPGLLTQIINPLCQMTGYRPVYLPFQLITLARKLSITFFIALSQLGPLLEDPNKPDLADGDGKGIPKQTLDRLDALSQATDVEVSRLLGFELTPFVASSSEQGKSKNGVRELRDALKEWMVGNTVRMDPEVRGRVQVVLERRRGEEVEARGERR